MKDNLPLKALIIVAPAALGYGASAVCPMSSKDGANIPFRPPPWVFMAVWPVLYGLLGWSAACSLFSKTEPEADRMLLFALHAALTLTLTAWVPLASRSCMGRKKEGLWLLLVSVLLCAYLVALDRRTAITLVPLLVWLSFAMLLSAFNVRG